MKKLNISDNDLKEIFALFTSVSTYELKQIYDPGHYLYFKNEDLDKEYELTEERRQYSLDSLRAVLYWLNKKGFTLVKGGNVDNLDWVKEELFFV